MPFISSALILYVIQSQLSGSSQRWPLLWIQPALFLLVDPANSSLWWIQPGLDPLLDPARAYPLSELWQCWCLSGSCSAGPISGFSHNWSHALVDPVTAGTISRCSHSLSHQWIQLQLVQLVNPAAADPLVDAISL